MNLRAYGRRAWLATGAKGALAAAGALACRPRTRVELGGPDGTRMFRRRVGELDVLAHADLALEPHIETLFARLLALHGEGLRLVDGARMPFAWTTISMLARDGDIVLAEPEYDGEDPERRVRTDLSVTLSVWARQSRLLDRLGAVETAIDFDQHVTITTDALNTDDVFMGRVPSPGARLTGWRIIALNEDVSVSDVQSLAVYDLLRRRPELLDALLLPPGYLVGVSGGRVVHVTDPADNIVLSESAEDGDASSDEQSPDASDGGGRGPP